MTTKAKKRRYYISVETEQNIITTISVLLMGTIVSITTKNMILEIIMIFFVTMYFLHIIRIYIKVLMDKEQY